MIITSNVTKSYGQSCVVDGVTLELPKGGITSIIGPNGAGKSTLLSMVSRLMAMDKGTVTVDGLDVSKTASDALARRLSILRQENHMTARLTVRDLVSFGRYPYSKGRLTETDRAYIEEAIGYLDLGALADRFLDELSGGQRQRAFVAMVLAQETELILLDEPASGLSVEETRDVAFWIEDMRRDMGLTVLMVEHDMGMVMVWAW